MEASSKKKKNIKGCCSDHNDSSSVVSVNSKKDYPTNFWSEHVALALKAAPLCNSCLQKPTFYQNICCVKSKITLQLAFLRFVPLYHKCISERFFRKCYSLQSYRHNNNLLKHLSTRTAYYPIRKGINAWMAT